MGEMIVSANSGFKQLPTQAAHVICQSVSQPSTSLLAAAGAHSWWSLFGHHQF